MLCLGDRTPAALPLWQNLLAPTVGFSLLLVEPQVLSGLSVVASNLGPAFVFLVQLPVLVVWVPFSSGV